MKAKTIKQLARSLDFTTDFEMYEYFITCYLNGNFTSCRRLFSELTKQAKKDVLSYLLGGGLNREYNFYFEIL